MRGTITLGAGLNAIHWIEEELRAGNRVYTGDDGPFRND